MKRIFCCAVWMLVVLVSGTAQRTVIASLGTGELTFTGPIAGECDGSTGTFGVVGGEFIINDIEGTACCPCAFSGGLDECGFNNNLALEPAIFIGTYCDVSVSAIVRSEGPMECRQPTQAPFVCTSNLPISAGGDPGRDEMQIEVIIGTTTTTLVRYCGDQIVDGLPNNTMMGIDGLSDPIIGVYITGGTEAIDERYVISDIIIEGEQVLGFDATAPLIQDAPTASLCAGSPTQPLEMEAQFVAGATYQWTLDGTPLSETGNTILRPLPALTDAGTYEVTIYSAGGCLLGSESTTVDVQSCAATTPTFSNIQTRYCETDVINLPNISDEGYTGQWDIPNGTAVSSILGTTEITFTPFDSTIPSYTTPLVIDVIPVYGSFPMTPHPACFFVENPFVPIATIAQLDFTYISQVTIDNDIVTPTELISWDASSRSGQIVEFEVETIPFGVCGSINSAFSVVINGIDTGATNSLVLCESDNQLLNFEQLIDSRDLSGVWTELDGTNLDLNTQDQNVDVSGLTPGIYRFDYAVGGSGGCARLSHVTTFTLEKTNTSLTRDIMLCPGEVFSFNGTDYDYDITLTENKPSLTGCDSILTYNISVVDFDRDTMQVMACPGHPFVLDGNSFDRGTVLDTILTSGQCDSIITYEIMMMDYDRKTMQVMACPGHPFVLDGNSYDRGTVLDTIPTSGQCDTIITYEIMMMDYIRDTINTTACVGIPFIFQGTSYTTDTTLVDTINIAGQCDLIETYIVQATTYARDTTSVTTCSGLPFVLDGIPFASDTTLVDTLSISGMCDRIVTYMVKAIASPTSVDSVSACVGVPFVLDGVSYSTDTLLMDTISMAGFCDSIVRYVVSKMDLTVDTQEVSTCAGNPFVLDGITYETDTLVIDTVSMAGSCDQVTFYKVTLGDYFRKNELKVYCPALNFQFNEISFNQDTTIYDTINISGGCDSIITYMLMIDDYESRTEEITTCSGVTFELNGLIYNQDTVVLDTVSSVSGGCDTIVTYEIKQRDFSRDTLRLQFCSGETDPRTGQIFLIDTTYSDTISLANMCDRIIHYEISVMDAVTSRQVIDRCVGDGFELEVRLADGTISLYNESRPSGQDTILAGSIDGCDSIVVVALNFTDQVTSNNDLSICSDDTITVGSSQYYSGLLSGRDTFLSVLGCDSIVITNLTIEEISIDTSIIASCQEESSGSVIFFNLGSDPLEVSFDFASYMFSDSVTISGLAANAEFDYSVSSPGGCSVSGSLLVPSLPASSLSIDASSTSGDSILLETNFAGTINEIRWSSTSSSVCTDCISIFIDSSVGGIYTLEIIDTNGCLYTAYYEVEAPTTEPGLTDDIDYYIANVLTPSATTPNNSLFLQSSSGDIASYDLTVFNRWGNQLYQRTQLRPNDPVQGWQGDFDDNKVAEGVYIYKITIYRASNIERETNISGDVLLIY